MHQSNPAASMMEEVKTEDAKMIHGLFEVGTEEFQHHDNEAEAKMLLESKEEVTEEVPPKSDFCSINVTCSDDNTQLRLDTVIDIKSDFSAAEEKKEDEQMMAEAEQAKGEMEGENEALPTAGAEPSHTPDESETETFRTPDQSVGQLKNQEEKVTESLELNDAAFTVENIEEKLDHAAEEARKIDVDLDLNSAPEDQTKELTALEKDLVSTDAQWIEKNGEEGGKEGDEPAPVLEETKQAPYATSRGEDFDHEVVVDSDDEGTRSEEWEGGKEGDEPAPVLEETKQAPYASSSGEDFDHEAQVADEDTGSEDSDLPIGEAEVTTKYSVSMESDHAPTERIITPKSAMTQATGTKSPTKSVQFAEDTIVVRSRSNSGKEEAKEHSVAGIGGDFFVCGEPLCGDVCDAAHELAEPNSLELMEDTDESSLVDSEKDEVSALGRKEAVELREKAEEFCTSQDQSKEKRSPRKVTVVDKKENESGVDVEEAAGDLNASDEAAGSGSLVSNQVHHHLVNPTTSFDVQKGMSCTAVFSCGVLAPSSPKVVVPEPERQFHMSLSHDLILEAREEAEKEVEARTLNGESAPFIFDDEMKVEETKKMDQSIGASALKGPQMGLVSMKEEGTVQGQKTKIKADSANQQEASPMATLPAYQAQPAEPREDPKGRPARKVTQDPSPSLKAVASPIPPPMKSVIVDDLDATSSKAHQEAYACGCTIL